MKLLDALYAEHELIERAVGSLVTFAGRVATIDLANATAEAERYLRFFRLFAGRYHHGREDGVLFPALVAETGVPADRGPIAVLLADHRRMEGLLAELGPLAARLGVGDGARSFADVVNRYAVALLQHIDAENSVLLPESAARFRGAAIVELPDRDLDDEEREARDAIAPLLVTHPPTDPPGLHRGEGCCACPAYGESCDGIEFEWWSEAEWEDARDRLGSQ